MYTWGGNQYGQLGLDLSEARVFVPTQVQKLNQFKEVSCGKSHTLAIGRNGDVYGAGDNSLRQLGIYKQSLSKDLIVINDQHHSTHVAAGCDFSLFLSD